MLVWALLAPGSRTSRSVRTAGVAEETSSSTSCGAAPTKAATASCALRSPATEPLIAPVEISLLTVNTLRSLSPGLCGGYGGAAGTGGASGTRWKPNETSCESVYPGGKGDGGGGGSTTNGVGESSASSTSLGRGKASSTEYMYGHVCERSPLA